VRITPTVGNTAPVEVPVGHRVLIFNDGRPHDFAPIDGMERTKLQMLYDSAAQR
jgi:hypothetical protein